MTEITPHTTPEEYAAICDELRADNINVMPDSPATLAAAQRHEDNLNWMRATAKRIDEIEKLLVSFAVVFCVWGTPRCLSVNPPAVRQAMGAAIANPLGDVRQGPTAYQSGLSSEVERWNAPLEELS